MTEEIWTLIHVQQMADGTYVEYPYNPMFDEDIEDFMASPDCRLWIHFRNSTTFKVKINKDQFNG